MCRSLMPRMAAVFTRAAMLGHDLAKVFAFDLFQIWILTKAQNHLINLIAGNEGKMLDADGVAGRC